MPAPASRCCSPQRTASPFIRARSTFADKVVDGITYFVDHGERDDIVRMLLSPENLAMGAELLASSGTGARHNRELWMPILTAAQRDGEMRLDLDPLQTCAWFAHLQLSFLVRLDLAELKPADRKQMLREFVLPALLPVTAPG